MNTLIEKVVGDLGGKRRWRAYRARVAALPEAYRVSARAAERYISRLGAIDDDRWVTAFEDLADLLERAAVDRTPIREVVGDDPIDFIEAFASNYGAGWRAREQQRFLRAIAEADAAGGDA